ncbi:MAG: isoaspartyl peptidase/L-asparaginase, partial [Acidimicrobiales bacterium]
MSREEADAFLREQVVGRVGCHFDGATYVVPVIYAWDGECAYVYSVEGQKVAMMRRNPAVCFEVDQYLPAGGWRSVIIQGTYEELEGDGAARALGLLSERFTPSPGQGAAPRPRAEGRVPVAFRLRAAELTGRRVERSLPAKAQVGVETGRLSRPALVLHGGAGTFDVLRRGGAQARAGLERALTAALEVGWRALDGGGPALAAVVEAVACLEDSGVFNAGRGSVPTTDGAVETDAAVMDGASGRASGACAMTWAANPVRVALAGAQLPGGTGDGRAGLGAGAPILLAGAGADDFARSAGLPPMPAPASGPGGYG